MSKVKIGFTKLNPSERVEKTRSIISRMTGNASFTTPVPSLLTLGLKASELETAIGNAMDGGHSFIALRNQRNRELMEMITQEAAYVQMASGGDADIIRSSGFEVVVGHSPLGMLPPPRDLRINYNRSRVLVLVWKAVKGRLAYVVEKCVGDPLVPTNWQQLVETGKARLVVNGLTEGNLYWFRVRTVGAAGVSSASEPVEGRALVSD